MQATYAEKGIKDLAQRIISLDPVEFDSAINQYFEANAVVENKTLYIAGSSRIKKLAFLQSLLAKESRLTSEPAYDEKNNIISLAFERTFEAPLIKRQSILHWTAKLHLLPDVGADGEVLYVTKVADLKRKEHFPFEDLVPFFILRPILSILAIVLADTASFFVQHKNESPATFVQSALFAILATVWGTVLAESGRRQAQAEKWSSERGVQFDNLYAQAKTTATGGLAEIESRAKAAGIPVDEYRKQAGELYAQARTTAADSLADLEARAKAAGIPVEDYKKQAATAVEELKKRAMLAGEYLEAKTGEVKAKTDEAAHEVGGVAGEAKEITADKANEAKDTVHDVADEINGSDTKGYVNGKAEEAKATFNDVTNDFSAEEVHTPLGGHDPTAPNAFSYAQAASQ